MAPWGKKGIVWSRADWPVASWQVVHQGAHRPYFPPESGVHGAVNQHLECRHDSAALDAHQGLEVSVFRQSQDEHDCIACGHMRAGHMSLELTLDVRGMEPPTPLERVLQMIDGFVVGDRLRLLIDCRAQPLYRILDRNGFGYREEPGTTSIFEVTIWRK